MERYLWLKCLFLILLLLHAELLSSMRDTYGILEYMYDLDNKQSFLWLNVIFHLARNKRKSHANILISKTVYM